MVVASFFAGVLVGFALGVLFKVMADYSDSHR
jgi:hypothetical protein